jgi:hypothetical protein
MQKIFNIIVFLALIIAGFNSYAVKEITFQKQTRVYAKKNMSSEVLGVFDSGDTVPYSDKVFGPWRKVLVDIHGKKTVGWILAKDTHGAKIKETKHKIGEEKSSIPIYRKKNGVGLMGNLSYVYQSKGDVTFDNAGTPATAQYSSLSGANVFLGFFGDFNYSKTIAVRGYFSMRNMKRAGKVTSSGSSGNFTLTHDLMALGTTVKFYSSPNAIFWWGPGLEIAKTTKYSISGSTDLVATEIHGDITKKPIYALLTISAGYDFNLSGNFFVLPEFKFGIVPNGSPMAATIEILIPIAYTF